LHSHGREARHFLDQHLAGAQARTLRPSIEQPAGAPEMLQKWKSSSTAA
jgi:hypothetical protein